MSVTIWGDQIRQQLCDSIKRAPNGVRVTIEGPRRTLDQNAKLHAMIGDIIKQRPSHHGFLMDAEAWKGVAMEALGFKVRWVPSLDGDRMVAIGRSTSKSTVETCSDLIEQFYAKGAEWGIAWSEPERWQHPAAPITDNPRG